MRVEFIVTGAGTEWRLKRGHTTPIRFRSCEAAMRAATAMAEATAKAGDRATVTLDLAHGERRSMDFAAEGFRQVDRESEASPYLRAP